MTNLRNTIAHIRSKLGFQDTWEKLSPEEKEFLEDCWAIRQQIDKELDQILGNNFQLFLENKEFRRLCNPWLHEWGLLGATIVYLVNSPVMGVIMAIPMTFILMSNFRIARETIKRRVTYPTFLPTRRSLLRNKARASKISATRFIGWATPIASPCFV